ncbi:MAG: AAA family ATPase [Sphingomonas sp.]|uniref:AAA family ATPase n=1 Tax=Sphingomonas sp. TaxID=28214 RepID=UPI002600DA0E|nr:AAA family ATPase [Sphingomonas sp.]MBX3566326.1 AAA family ATPase [Sphingomonas sp.]
MRRLSRPTQSPAVLQSPRVQKAKAELFAFLRRPPEERRQRRAPLDEDLFHDSEFGHVIYNLCAGKCAYCESPLRANLVRHFRPLQFAEPSYGIESIDYYLWLAFEWRNLLAACDSCEKAKYNRFPLQRGSRATYLARFDDIREQEYPLLLDPFFDDPRRYLQFLSDGSCTHKHERGAATILTLDLNREDLIASRREAINSWLGYLTEPGSHDRFSEMIVRGPFPDHFGLGVPHLAASLDVLRRILISWRGTSSRDVANIPTFLRNVAQEIDETSSDEHFRLARVAAELRTSDEARGPALRAAVQRDVQAADFVLASPVPAQRPVAFDREISRVVIDHMKAIDRLEIPFPASRTGAAGAPCLAILGENSTGKSTILSAIALALIGAQQARRLRFKRSHLLSSANIDRLDQLEANPVAVMVEYYASKEQAQFYLDADSEQISGQFLPTSVILGYGPRRYFSPRYRRRSEGARHRVKTLFDPLATIPYPNDWLAELTGDRFETVARALRIVLALNDDDRLINDPEDGMCVEANGRRIPVERLSEGYKSVFAMVVDIIHELLDHYTSLEQAQAVVLIDEIETHLHPRWKMQIMTSLRRALPRVQFIVTTHDPLCLRGMDDDEVLVLQRVEDAKIRPMLGLPSVKGMTAEQLLTSDYFGLSSTSDPRVELGLARITGDVVVQDAVGGATITLSSETENLLKSVSLGDSASETLMQDALKQYLTDREVQRGKLRSDVREEAVDAVLKALRAPLAD